LWRVSSDVFTWRCTHLLFLLPLGQVPGALLLHALREGLRDGRGG